MLKKFDIVIVNWNSGHQLKDCILSIMESSFDQNLLGNVIVVDNNSKDQSIEIVEALAFDKLKFIKNEDNLGFGKACNLGSKGSTADFILFLNPDAIVYEDTFSKLFSYISKYDTPEVAVYSVQLIGDDKKVQRNCAKTPSIYNFINRSLGLNKISAKWFPSYTMEDWNHLDTKQVDQVMGAFFMIKRPIFEELNGFDERFFVYYEELELSKRMKDKGYKTTFIAEIQAYHKGGGTSEQVKAHRLFYNTRSRLIYGMKHFGLIQGSFLIAFTFIVEPISRTFFLIFKRKYSDIRENIKGFRMLYADTFKIYKLGLKK